MNPSIHRSGILKLVIMSPKINLIGNFCWLGKSQFTLLLVLINSIPFLVQFFMLIKQYHKWSLHTNWKITTRLLYQKVKYNHEIAISFKYCNFVIAFNQVAAALQTFGIILFILIHYSTCFNLAVARNTSGDISTKCFYTGM